MVRPRRRRPSAAAAALLAECQQEYRQHNDPKTRQLQPIQGTGYETPRPLPEEDQDGQAQPA